MDKTSRRSVLTAAAVAAAASSARPAAAAADDLAVGLIGCGGQGRSVARSLAGKPGVRIACVCDPDESRRERARAELDAPAAVADLRRVIDDKAVDAVVVATPDHWHAPASILACSAGKHVYVEKPCSHNLLEAGLLVDSARAAAVVVQHGTQSRSNPLLRRAVRLIREGAIGDVLVAKGWNVQRRAEIGRGAPAAPPPGVDYDLWVGPAPFLPFQENRFHYHWRWWHAFGTGDIGNDGTHEIDYVRWGLGVDCLPRRVVGLGGKYAFNDDQEFPDTATLVFEFPAASASGTPRQLVFEMRLWSGNYPNNCDSGAEFYGTRGQLFVSKRGKLELFDGANKRVPLAEDDAEPAPDHQADFVDAIRTGRRPAADIEEGYRTVALVHLGNIAIRTGRTIEFDAASGKVRGDEAATALVGREYRPGHWAVPSGIS